MQIRQAIAGVRREGAYCSEEDAKRCGRMGDSSVEAGMHLRVALVGCSGLLGDIIGETLEAQPDLEVVAELDSFATDDDLILVAPDLVVWNNADDSWVARWLSEVSNRCGPRVLATVGDGRDASLWELVPQRNALGALSPTTLVEAIRRSFEGVGGEPR